MRIPPTVDADWINSPAPLAAFCEAARALGVLALDTEFVRERTFYPKTGLIQAAIGDRIALIDPLALGDLEPLAALLRDPNIVKIVHSPSEDLEVFRRRLDAIPTPLFDTQLAAAFVGRGWSRGYGALVHDLFGIELPKGETRSNWLRRPLSDSQKHYAALDVLYLPRMHARLEQELRDLGRVDWMRQEMDRIEETARTDDDRLGSFRKLGRRRGASRRQLGVLHALVLWREHEARERDLPRGFVLADAALVEIAQRPPRSVDRLRAVDELRPADIKRHGRAIVRVVREALALPKHDLPMPPPQPTDLTPHKEAIGRLRDQVAEIAERHDLPRELLATRRTVERVARRLLDGVEPALPAGLRGWRREIVGEPLLEQAQRELLEA
ncbi:MAG: ribonuclease D [Acidobacteriota bacterium]